MSSNTTRDRARGASTVSRLPLGAIISGVFLLAVIGVAALAPWLPLPSPTATSLADRFAPIGTAQHPLGTDSLGRDMVSLLVFGARTSLLAGVLPVLIATVIGILLGATAASSPRLVNALIMRGLDLLLVFPGVLLVLLIAFGLGAGLGAIMVGLTVVLIPPISRVAEAEVARTRQRDFVPSARASGATGAAIVVRQILPVALPQVLAYSTSYIGATIAAAGGLGYLGLGVDPSTPELGTMLRDLQSALYSDPALAVVPAVAIIVLALSFAVVGDGLGRALRGQEVEQ